MTYESTCVVTTTTFVLFQSPDVFSPEETVCEVDLRDLKQTAKHAPRRAYAFYYYDQVTVVVNIGGQEITAKSVNLNISKTYYLDAVFLNYDAVAALPGDVHALLNQIRGDDLDGVVRCRTGSYQPFQADKHELVSSL